MFDRFPLGLSWTTPCPSPLRSRSIPTVKRVSTTATAYADLQFSSGKGGKGVPHSLRSMRSKHTLLLTSSASLPDGSSGGTATIEAMPLMQPSWILPRCSLDLLFEELGLLAYLGRFQEESIQLDQLLCMEVGQLEQLGLRCARRDTSKVAWQTKTGMQR